MLGHKNTRLILDDKELQTLKQIEARLLVEIPRGVASYSAAKQYSNFFERLSRKYRVKPSTLLLRKKTGEIIRRHEP